MTRRGDGGAPLSPADFEGAFRSMSGLTAGPILAAISGGPDSTALLHGLAAWSRQTSARPPVVAATVDHGLRVEGRAEAEAVASDAASLGLEHRILAWTGARRHPVSQDAARRARYRLLGECAAAVGAAALVTAHTLDDQAETLLIRMAAGSGLSGLGGMRAVTYRGGLAHHRPLLAIPKARLVATCRAGGWRFTDDASNHEARFARTRWRALVPELASEGLDAERLSRLAGRLRRADDALDALAGRIFSRTVVDRVPDGVVLDFARLADEPDEIKLRVLALALRDSGAAPNRLERLERCCESLLEAARAGRLARRTLAGRIVALDGTGTLRILPETARSIARASPVTLPAAGTPHSLGNGETGA